MEEVDGDEGLVVEAANALTYAAGLTTMKLEFAFSVPYLLVNADDPATAARCLEQYDASPENQHRVTAEFCSPQGALRVHTEACAAGNGCHPDLLVEIRSLCGIRLAEDELEGLHRNAKMEHTRAPASRLPWTSASLTLEQNFNFVSEALKCTRISGYAA